MSLFRKEFFNWHTRDNSYNRANNFCYGVLSSNSICELVTPSTKAIYIDFLIRSESESSYLPKNSDYRNQEYNFYYDLVISNQNTEYKKRLFSRHYKEYGTTGLFGDFKEELEDLDEPKVVQGLEDYFNPLLKHLSSKNGLENGDAALNNLFRTIGSVKPVVNKKEPNSVCYKSRVTLNFLDAAKAREQRDESRVREKESAVFDGPVKWISFRFHFTYGKGPEKANRTKLVLTIINGMGASLEYDVFDFRCNIENYKGWYESWVSFVNTEGKIKITQLLNRLSGYHECASNLVEWESINRIISKVAGRSDFEVSFNFSDGSQTDSGNKGNKQRAKKTQNDKSSIWLGLLGLEDIPDSFEELKKAYRNACFAFHPDRFTDVGKKKWAEGQLKKVSTAFDELSKLYA